MRLGRNIEITFDLLTWYDNLPDMAKPQFHEVWGRLSLSHSSASVKVSCLDPLSIWFEFQEEGILVPLCWNKVTKSWLEESEESE
jgi:hypothetical protein